MNDNELLERSISRVAWGYVFLYLNFNIGTLNILPNWACYALALSALPGLARAERSAALLRPLGWILLAAGVAQWLFDAVAYDAMPFVAKAVVSVLSLYFHFQLLTNVADIAEGISAERAKSIRSVRNLNAVATTLLALPWPVERLSPGAESFVAFALVLLAIVIIAWSFIALFGLARDIRGRAEADGSVETDGGEEDAKA